MSPKSVAQKLRMTPDGTLWLSHPVRVNLLEPLPENVRLVSGPDQAQIAVVFVDDAASVRKIMGARRSQLARTATIWIAYPKTNKADINRDSLWPILAEFGMRPIGQVAIDDVWSALRFRVLRAGEAPFTGDR
jgi:hypothetical protein